MSYRHLVVAAFLISTILPGYSQSNQSEIKTPGFRLVAGDKGVSGISNPADPFGASVVDKDKYLELEVRFKTNTNWTEIPADSYRRLGTPTQTSVEYVSPAKLPVKVIQRIKAGNGALDWDISLESTSKDSVSIGDLGIEIPVHGPWSEDPREIFERSFIRHQFISGSGSFLYFVRPSGAPPFLVVTVKPGTKLEYFADDKGRSVEFIHSGVSGSQEQRGTWRQPHTTLTLGPAGSKNSNVHYGFRFQWAQSYSELRDILYREGLFDFRAVPGMTVPIDLKAQLALRTAAHIESIEPEFPGTTKVSELGVRRGYRVYEITFSRLGENKLTIHHDGGRATFLEYFVTEPLEALIKKRSAFLVNRQQSRDTTKWWDGAFLPYDMRNKVLRSPDDPDIFTGRMAYVLTCDDPGLSKAPFLALKNVSFPEPKEIEALEYYLQHFVWGKLQRTDEEIPYPYGVYGTPDWYTNRDPQRRAKITSKNLEKMHVWRSYDYPHIVMLYFHMYEIAKKYPAMSKYLSAPEYLQRAYNTARAFYQYPYEIMPDYYETYKWGLYNELTVLSLIDALDTEGFPDQADWLRKEWEKKVKYFVYDDPYPFRSEYAFDRTAFESSYAFAKYGSTHEMTADENLWWDVKYKKWYSHPAVKKEDSRELMERQLAAGLTVRGWLEPTFYQFGADPGLSYMAAMGGWGILDYGLNFAEKPDDWLQLGYASYLSSWSLVNSGPAEHNYGYWYPGKENDGAAGWQFMSEKFGHAWMGTDVPRGPWRYDGEIDLGFSGALRSAATIVTRDETFGWIAYGGQLSPDGDALRVIPRDGLRQRFVVMLPNENLPWPSFRRFKMALDRDGFAANESVEADKSLNKISFRIENRTQDSHLSGLKLSFPIGETYEVRHNGIKIVLERTGDWDYPWYAPIKMSAGSGNVEITRVEPKL